MLKETCFLVIHSHHRATATLPVGRTALWHVVWGRHTDSFFFYLIWISQCIMTMLFCAVHNKTHFRAFRLGFRSMCMWIWMQHMIGIWVQPVCIQVRGNHLTDGSNNIDHNALGLRAKGITISSTIKNPISKHVVVVGIVSLLTVLNVLHISRHFNRSLDKGCVS